MDMATRLLRRAAIAYLISTAREREPMNPERSHSWTWVFYGALLILGLIMLYASIADAAPFIVSDPFPATAPGGTAYAVPTHCSFKLDSAAATDIPVGKDAANKDICKIDISAVTVGTHTAVVKTVRIDPVWGRLESPPAPNFTFARPAATPTPAGMVITP